MTPSAKTNCIVALLIIAVSVSKTLNDFTSKIKAMTLEVNGKEYNWVTALPDAILYLLFSAACLTLQYCRGAVTWDQLRYVFTCNGSCRWSKVGGWKYLLLASINDVADLLTGLAAQPHLTTCMFALANQSTALFTAFFSMLLIGTRYIAQEVISLVCIVTAAVLGVVVTVELGGSSGSGENSAGWAIFASATTSFAALGFVIKEMMFAEYKQFDAKGDGDESDESQADELEAFDEALGDGSDAEELSDKTLSVFVVSTGVAAVSIVVSLPMALLQQAILEDGFATAWGDLKDGLHQLVRGEHALFAYTMYIICNIAFNLALLLLTSYGSALMAFLSLKLAVPLIAILSPLPWPIIGSDSVSGAMWLILVVMLVAIAAFRHGTIKRQTLEVSTCCWPLCESTEPDEEDHLGNESDDTHDSDEAEDYDGDESKPILSRLCNCRR